MNKSKKKFTMHSHSKFVMKKLIIFTKLFPYGKTEAFLESEVGVISKYFDEIIFCPTYKSTYIREIPDNAKINSTFIINYWIFIYAALLSIVNGNFFLSLFDHRKKIKSLKSIITLYKYSIFDVYYKLSFKKQKLELNNSVIYSYWFNPRVNSIIKLKEKNKLNCKIITRAHRWDIYETETLQFPYREYSIKKIVKIYSISSDGKKYLDEKYNTNNKVIVSRLGVFDKGHINLPSEDNHLHIVSVSQVTERKRVLLILESLIELAKTTTKLKIKWTHFGIGNLFDKLNNQVNTLRISNLEIDLKGYVRNTEIYDFYKKEKIDLFINVSESEGIPVSIMEAQSFGIPVIATDVGGTTEIVNDDIGKLLSSVPDIEEINNAIKLVTNKRINRNDIKESWNKLSNAEKNFTEFANSLLSL